MLCKNIYTEDEALPNSGHIRVISYQLDCSFKVEIGAHDGIVLRLSEMLGWCLSDFPAPIFVSWLMTLSQPVGETFWVSYRPDGVMFGKCLVKVARFFLLPTVAAM